MTSTIVGLIMIASGVFAMLGSALNWRIVTGSEKLLNMLLGDTVARVIYFLTGVILFVLGIGELIDADWLPV
jgi:hypothetical protein